MATRQISGIDPSKPTQEQVAAANDVLAKLSEPIGIIIVSMLRGVIGMFGHVAAHIVMNIIAFQVGNQLARMLGGDVATMTTIRRGLIAAFNQGVQAAPTIVSAKTAPPPPGTGWP